MISDIMSDVTLKFNLIVNYYCDKNAERADELNFCILENIRNENLSKIIVIVNEADYKKLKDICGGEVPTKVTPIVTEVRPTHNYYYYLLSKLCSGDDNINIVSNLDIIMPETLLYCSYYMPDSKTCLALSRWDVNNKDDYKNNSTLYDHADSQDTWIFKGEIPEIAGANFGLGIAGTDNSIAHLLEKNGYNVLNPSKTIKTYHLHLTNIRNYTNVVGHAIERIQPPYKLIHPTV